MSDETRISSEKRYLSVLFCDLVDSTGHLYRLGSEPFADLLADYRRVVFESVRRHGGYVARVVGDGVLAYFGWPRSLGWDARAAVRCALDIAAAIPHLQEGAAYQARLAVETGWVLI